MRFFFRGVASHSCLFLMLQIARFAIGGRKMAKSLGQSKRNNAPPPFARAF
jgi:hypothetical protein